MKTEIKIIRKAIKNIEKDIDTLLKKWYVLWFFPSYVRLCGIQEGYYNILFLYKISKDWINKEELKERLLKLKCAKDNL